MKQPSFSLGYRPFLDGIRGVGVLIVMAAHSFIASVAAAGMLALQLFFILSGFLITALLVREWDKRGSISLKNFYIRRALRLLPALVLFLAVSCVVVAATFPPAGRTEHFKGAFAALFYFYNWGFIYDVFQPGILSHCWSLAVEEHFYLVWPAVLVVLLRLPVHRTWKLLVVIAGILASVITRVILLRIPDPEPWRVLLGSDMHADALLLGCLVGLLACWDMLPEKPKVVRAVKTFAAFAVLYLAWHLITESGPRAPKWNPNGQAYDGQVYRVIALGLIFVTLLTSPPKLALWLLESRVIVWLGRRSYSIYLWHFGINGYLLIRYNWPEVMIAVPGAILSFAIAAASFRWVETPFLRLKTRYSAPPATIPALEEAQAQRAPGFSGS